MKITERFSAALLATVAASALLPTAGWAADSGVSESDIIVTATRREDSINKVPLSISALSAKSLEKMQVRGIDDLRRNVPGIGLQFGNNSDRASTSGDTNISIRGISAIVGAATTGVYIDDVPVHKTATLGTGFGAGFPKSFDLDRVEVLRGPQGTLFGGSTEGGAIRFITAQPSLDTQTMRVKLEGSMTENGQESYEVGGVIGGPIIKDVLGIRATAWHRRDGGYLDHVSRFTGNTLAKDTNDQVASLFRVAVAWKPTDDLLITPSFAWQRDKRNDTDQFWENVPAFTAPAVRYNVGAAPAGLRPCTPATCAPSAITIPAHTYGPYDMFGPGRNGLEFVDPVTGAETASLSPRRETTTISSLTLDYDFGPAAFKSITSYYTDRVKGLNDNTFLGGPPTTVLTGANTYPANEIFSYPALYVITPYINRLKRFTQEFRLTSQSDSKFSWVAGAYYSITHFKFNQTNLDNSEFAIAAVRNTTYQGVFGFPIWGGMDGTDPRAKSFAGVVQTETNVAAYGEVNYQATDRLKLTAGLRFSRDESRATYTLLGAQNNGLRVATIANGGLLKGNTSASPVTPKFSVSYNLSDDDMIYATVARGYRAGGFNGNVQGPLLVGAGVCQPSQLALVPTTFGPDSVWSYEAGAKIRLGGLAQINSSAYHIKWQNVQTTVATPFCGQYIDNAGTAVSNGFDVQVELRPVDWLRLNGTVGYTDAHYTKTVSGSILGGATNLVLKGEPVRGVPEWTYNVGATLDFGLFGRKAYITGDYQYVSAAKRSTGPGTIGYTPDTYNGNALHFANFRAGVDVTDSIDFQFYIKNLTNSHDLTNELGGPTAQRPVVPMHFAQTFRPREFGISLNYGF